MATWVNFDPAQMKVKVQKLTRLLLSLDSLKPLCIDKHFSVFKRTLDHLKSWQLVIPSSIKQANYNLSLQEKDIPQSTHWGSWMFLYENVPQLKYHNPSVEFTISRHYEGDSVLELKSENGEVKRFPTTGLNQKEIQEQLETFSDR